MQLKRKASQTLKGSKFERKTKSLFKPKFGNKEYICVVVAVAVLVVCLFVCFQFVLSGLVRISSY